MRFAVRHFVFGLLISMLFAGSASAQYMKITTDNPVSNLRMRASGTTILTITLDTNHDKNGLVQTCNSHSAATCGAAGTAQPLDMYGYTLALKAVGGTVTWGAFTPADAAYTDSSAPISNPTEIEINQFRPTGTFTAPGLATIGTLAVTTLSGTPAIQLQVGAGLLNPFGFGTGFATECDGNQNPNFYVVGDPADPCGTLSGLAGDWFDWDGALSASGNTPPVIVAPPTASGSENTALAPIVATATDADAANTLTITQTGMPGFLTFTSSPGPSPNTASVSGTPGFSDAGTYNINWLANDGAGGTSNTTTVLTVANTDRAPALTQPADMTVNEGSTAEQTLVATDPDADPLSFQIVSGPPYMTIGATTGIVRLVPDFTQSGTASATVRATDGTLFADKSFGITVNNTNRAPTLLDPVNMSVTEGATADQVVTGSDPDGDALTFSKGASDPAFMTVTTLTSTTGNIHLAPVSGAAAGSPYLVSVIATDTGALTSTKSFQITVAAGGGGNLAPTLNQPASMTVDEGSTADQTITGSDPESTPLIFAKVLGPTYMSVTTTNATTGNIHLAPGFSDAGTTAATVSASDGLLSDSKTFTITVNNVDRAPTLAQPANMTVTEGGTAEQTLSATDPDGDALQFTVVSGPTFLTVSLSLGVVHLAPTTGDAAGSPYSATVSASDGTLNDTKTFTITVNPAAPGNVPPVLAQPSDMTVNEGSTADQTLNATDADGDAVTFSRVSSQTFVTVTTTSPGTGTATGLIHLAPGFSDAGTYSVTVRASDSASSNDKSLTVTVNNTDRAPTLNPITNMTVTEGATADQGITASDPDGDALTFGKVTGPAFVTITTVTSTSGNVHVAPSTGDAATLAYTVQAEATDGTLNDTRIFSVLVNAPAPGNEPPVLAQPDNMTVDEGSTADQTITATDPNGDPLSFSKVDGPSFMSVTTTTAGTGTGTGSIHLAPGFSDAGTYAATVRASDGALGDNKTLTITVNNTNRAPTLSVITNMTVTEGATADQVITASDPDGDALTFAKATGPTFLTVTTTNGTTGSIHLAPTAGDATGSPYLASASASDGSLSDTKGFLITVVAAGGGNQAPTLTQPGNMTVDEGATADQALTASDPDGDALTFARVGGPTFMTVATLTSTTGNVHLAPGFSDAGTYGATVSASDASLSDQKSFTITVVNVNRPPVADAGGPYTGVIGVPVSFDGTGSSDPDGNALTYSWDFDSTDGITSDATGATPSHTYGAPGTYTVTLTVTDDNVPSASDTDTATATIAESGGFQVQTFLNGADRIIRLNTGRPFWCVQLEPVGHSFNVTDIIVSSVVASFGGVSVHAIVGKRIVVEEEDDVTRLRICFDRDSLRVLFASLPDGRHSEEVTISGDLSGGGSFQTTVDVVVIKAGPGGLARGNEEGEGRVIASPNPLNPSTLISFELSKPGSVKLNVYDVSGRLVKTLADRFMGSGVQHVAWDGTSRTGSRVASGVYFYVLETPERTVKSQLVVAK